jgi:hypothetical protein
MMYPSNTRPIEQMKLNRKAVAQALKQVPIDTVLLGAVGAKQTPLTEKQKRFAENVAMGKTGAQSYREAYNTQGLAMTQGQEAARLKADPRIAAQIEAFRVANEAMRHATPAALRSLVIQKLTEHAIDPGIQPAQRLQALKLLGTVTEVAAFTERREIIKTTDPQTAKAALLETLRQALRASSIDAEIVESKQSPIDDATVIELAAGLAPDVATLTGPADDNTAPGHPDAQREGQDGDPTGPAPPALARAGDRTMLSNPHTRSQVESAPHTRSLSESASQIGSPAAPTEAISNTVSDALHNEQR